MNKPLQNSVSPAVIFCAYAKTDELFYQKLEKSLAHLKEEQYIASWCSRQAITGINWAHVVDPNINTASIILLLLTPDFIASDYFQGFEMQRACERHIAKEAYIFPIFLRSTDWQDTLLACTQVLPTDIQPIPCPIASNEAVTNIIYQLRLVIMNLDNIILRTTSSSPIPLWNIPYSRNDLFTGQIEVLSRISAILESNHTRENVSMCALCGPSGSGKTEIAIEYTYRFQHRYLSIFWVRADTSTALVFAFANIANQLNFVEKNAVDKRTTIKAVINWLSLNSTWLLIFDNLSSLHLVKDFLPPVFRGHVLLTTQAPVLEKLVYNIQIEPFSPQEGGSLLLRYRDAHSRYAPLSEVTEEETDIAEEIARETEGLPLAIVQAAAYTVADAYSVGGYLSLHRRERVLQRKEHEHILANYIHPASITFRNGFERLEKHHSAAIEMLQVCVFLYPEAIPEEILLKGVASVAPQAQRIAKNYSSLKEDIEWLCNFTLLERDPGNQAFDIHPLVQSLVKNLLDTETYQYWGEKTVLAVNKSFPKRGAVTWQKCQRWLLQALACADIIESINIILPEAASLLYRSGSYAYEFGLYTEARLLLQKALSVHERLLGQQHLETQQTQLISAILSKLMNQENNLLPKDK